MERQYIAQEGTRGAISRRKRAAYVLVSVGAVTLVSVLVFLFFPDPFINTFLKGRISEAFREAYPAYAIDIGSIHYSIRENRIGFVSVALTTRDSSLTCTIAAYSVSGIGWFELLWARGLVPSGFTGTVLDAQGIVATFPREQYELRCGLLRASVPDSEIVAEAVMLQASGEDEQFFARSEFSTTRFRVDLPRARLMGLACLDMLQGKRYRARSAHLRDLFINVLINKNKPSFRDTVRPPMPLEILALVKETIEVDSVSIRNGSLLYGERYAGSRPAVITLDRMQVEVQGVQNQGEPGDTMVIRANGEFMKSAEMNLLMSFPISTSEFSFRYSGSMSEMELNKLNPFLEIAEQVRVKSGSLHAAAFDIRVVAGQARGSVQVVYNDLNLAAINKRTGSEKGIIDVIASFVANTVTIRTNNMPDNAGVVGMGKVKYTRQRDDPFFRYVWFAVRSGLGDVVGF